MDKNKCLDCNEELTGRADKKFCNDACRGNYNNKQNKDANNLVRKINSILRKNRRIIEALCPEGKAKVHATKLTSEGFNFDYHTSTLVTKKSQTYYFCYDYGYLELDNNYYILVRRN